MSRRLCVKVRYLSRRAARHARRHLPSEHLRAYWCEPCHGWHLGHLPPAVLYGLLLAEDVYGPARRAA